ncbi:MAG: hypothetical protein JXR07_12655 [Reichenbachiella sp.]
MGKYIFLIIATCLLTSCAENVEPINSNLENQWVEIQNQTDTLHFVTLNDIQFLTLKRGTEIRDGQHLPKYRSGLYHFEISENTISLRWQLSSDSNFEEYSFNRSEDLIEIGNFYQEGTLGNTLLFRKL